MNAFVLRPPVEYVERPVPAERLAGGVVLGVLAAAAFCLACEWIVDRVPSLQVSLIWGVALVVPWALAWETAKRLAIAGHIRRRILMAIAFAAAAWVATAAIQYSTIASDANPLYLLFRQLPLFLIGAAAIAFTLRRVTAPAQRATPGLVAEAIEVAEPCGVRRIALPAIESVHAAGNYVELSASGRRILHRATMQEMEDRLGPHGFARIHRATIVNASAVVHRWRDAEGRTWVRLASGAALEVSRRRVSALRRR